VTTAATNNTTSSHRNKKKISIIISVLITALIVNNLIDSLLFKSGHAVIRELYSSTSGIVLFIIVIVVLYGAGIYLVSILLNSLYAENARTNYSLLYFKLLYKALKIVQYTTIGILTFIIFQILLTTYYYVGLLIIAEMINFTYATILMALLSYKFFSWYKLTNKKNSNNATSILLYGITFAIVAIGTGTIATFNSSIIWLEKPLEVTSNNFSNAEDSATASTLLTNTYMPLRVAFVMFWITTVLLLHSYSKKLGRLKFWTIVSLPLLSFLIGVILEIRGYLQQLSFHAVLSQSIVLVGGIFFAIAFLTAAKNLQKIHSTISYYLTISAYGIVLVVISLTQPVIDISYPPFIGVNWTFIGLASYLYSLGFYFSATSIAQDTNLRQSIRQQFAVIKESGLLDNIGTAQMEQEIRRRVLKIAKEQQEVLEEQTEIQQQPFSEEDIKQYLDEVLEEAKKLHKQK
jgi:hypothetical protein